MSMAIEMSSPSGKMSKRAHKAATERLALALWGEDAGVQPDMFGNEHIVIIKSKGVTMQSTLEQYLKDQENLNKMEGGN